VQAKPVLLNAKAENSMDLEQLLQRIQWIEDDRRKEKDSLALLENRLVGLEGGLSGLAQQIKELSAEITRLSTVVTRMDQYDNTLLQQRIETKRILDELDKEAKKRGEEANKVRLVEVKALENTVYDVKKELEILPKLDKGLQLRIDEETRLHRMIEELQVKLAEARRGEEEYVRTIRLLDDSRRQDAKRIQDIQGELTTIRKRSDDQKGQIELLSNGIRRLDTRLNELVMVETERRDAMNAFLDKQNMTQVERDRVWRDWQSRFETIEKQSTDIESALLSLDTTQRMVKQAQGILDELSQKVERRINEITEIQRLSEDRFRQEWVTFKADDQKRWTNYTLTQEEQRDEMQRQFGKSGERVTLLEDGFQELQDLLAQSNEQSEKRLQSLLALVHEWVSVYERTVGRSRG